MLWTSICQPTGSHSCRPANGGHDAKRTHLINTCEHIRPLGKSRGARKKELGEWRISILAGRPSCGGPSVEDLRSAVRDVHGPHGGGTSPSGWAQSEPRGPELRRRDPYLPNRRIARRWGFRL